MTHSSRKTQGLLCIILPPVILICVLFLRVVLGLFVAYGEAPEEPAFMIFTTLLNFIALLCVIGMIGLIPLGIVLLLKEERGSKAVVKSGAMALAGRAERWVANFLDSILTFIPPVFVAMIFARDESLSLLMYMLVVLVIGGIQAYYLTIQGQTIAKKWLGIRIVDAKTKKVGGFVQNVLVRSVLNFFVSFLPFYGLLDALFIFRDDRRCIHDLMAGTIVVSIKAKAGGAAPSKTHPAVWVFVGLAIAAFAVGVIGILAAIVIVAINPTKQLEQARNAQRRSDVNVILNATYQYAIDHDLTLPAALPTTPQEICQSNVPDCSGLIDLSALEGSYLVRLPRDPSTQDPRSTKYTMMYNEEAGSVTVSAPRAEAGEVISVTR